MDAQKQLRKRWAALLNERASWDAHWREISEHLLPRSGRFLSSDRNNGKKKHHSIYDSTGTRALRILSAGLMSGMTSPARPWFRLATADPELMKLQAVKIWLSDVTSVLLTIFAKSNTYRALASMYAEIGAFGVAASIITVDARTVIHHTPLTVGEYCIATNFRGEVTTLHRQMQLTVGQLVEEFGLENVSTSVANLYAGGNLDAWVEVVHAIEPRESNPGDKMDAKNMPWRSCYFEAASNEKMLREGGFRRFPALVPRWDVTGGDIYGTSPGMEVLGDVKQLQHQQMRKAQGIDYQTNPPLQAPTSFKNSDLDTMPGGISFVDSVGADGGIRSAFSVGLDLSHLTADIGDVRQRINAGMYADLFLMLAGNVDTRMTATEVAQRVEEKLLMLGPVLERLKNELLDPLIEITFEAALQAGKLPKPPPELQGTDIDVELVSMLAQAQKSVGTNTIDRFITSLGMVAQFKPDVLDKLDSDAWVDAYGDALGVDPRLIVSKEDTQAVRQARADAAAQAQQVAMLQQGADAAQKLATAQQRAPMDAVDPTAQFSGYA